MRSRGGLTSRLSSTVQREVASTLDSGLLGRTALALIVFLQTVDAFVESTDVCAVESQLCMRCACSSCCA